MNQQDIPARARHAAGEAPYRAALRTLRPGLALALGFSALVNILMLTGSVYMLQVYDRVLASGSVPTLVMLFVIVVVLYGFLGFYDFLRARILSRSAMRLDRALGAQAFGGWMRSGLAGTSQAGATPDEALAMRDLATLRGFVGGPAITAIFDLPFVPLYLGVLFLLHPLLGWLTVAGAGIGVVFAFLTRTVTSGAARRSAVTEGMERDLVEAARRGAETVTAMGMQAALVRRWSEAHDRTLAATQSGSDPGEALAASSRTFRMLLQSAILTLGAWLVLGGEISAGMIIASSILSGRALAPVDQITGQWRQIGQASEANRRLAQTLAEAPAATRLDLPDPAGRLTVAGLLRLAPLRPGTDPAAPRRAILTGVNFALEPGDAMAVIGSSASGKSTLARLIIGTLAPDAGEVRLDGATLDQWDPARRGRFLGYLPQQVEFLPGTIQDAIARFDPEAPASEVIAAARLAGVHEMILRLPEGYGTMLGLPGRPAPLSGGQLQRVALARAVYGRPALVVLDEPNSNLDGAGEKALNQAIEALRAAGSAVVVMAHRTSILAAVNKLLMLEDGRMTIFGDRDEILARAALTNENVAAAEVSTAAPAADRTSSVAAEAVPQPIAASAASRVVKRRAFGPVRPAITGFGPRPFADPAAAAAPAAFSSASAEATDLDDDTQIDRRRA